MIVCHEILEERRRLMRNSYVESRSKRRGEILLQEAFRAEVIREDAADGFRTRRLWIRLRLAPGLDAGQQVIGHADPMLRCDTRRGPATPFLRIRN